MHGGTAITCQQPLLTRHPSHIPFWCHFSATVHNAFGSLQSCHLTLVGRLTTASAAVYLTSVAAAAAFCSAPSAAPGSGAAPAAAGDRLAGITPAGAAHRAAKRPRTAQVQTKEVTSSCWQCSCYSCRAVASFVTAGLLVSMTAACA